MVFKLKLIATLVLVLSKPSLTPQIANEVFQHHLAVGFDVGAVHVCVEEDDGKSQDEDSVRILELAHQYRVTHTIPLTEREERNTEINKAF